jgi:predicted RNA binding protein YcfA (HicA-like mRNA interferase family)
MVRLYQIIHDIRFLKDATLDQLEGRHIPNSLTKRAFLPLIDHLETSSMLLHSELRAPPQQSFSAFPEDVSQVSKGPGTTRLGKMAPREDKRAMSPVKLPLSKPVIKRPDSATLTDVPQAPMCKGTTPPAKMEPKEDKQPRLSVSLLPLAPVIKRPDSATLEKVSHVPKLKVKKRPETLKPKEDKRAELSVSATPPAPVIERPDFPAKDASGQEVLYFLLNNGFVIQRATGSHYQMQHVATHIHTTVPYHRSIKPGTFSSIRDAFYRSQGFES